MQLWGEEKGLQIPRGNLRACSRAGTSSPLLPAEDLAPNDALARVLLPEIQAFFESEEGQREYAEWKAKQQTNSAKQE